MSKKPYSVELKAAIKRGSRTQAIIEVSIPCATLEEARAVFKPRVRGIWRTVATRIKNAPKSKRVRK